MNSGKYRRVRLEKNWNQTWARNTSSLVDILEKGKDDILKLYTEIRSHIAPSADLRRKIDACEAVTCDITKIIYKRITDIDGDFNAECERKRLRELLGRVYAISIYGSTAAKSGLSHYSSSSHIAVKWAEAAADLAAKKAEYKIIQEENKQRERIKALEEQHQRELEIQKSELERLQAGRGVEAAQARFEAYNREIEQIGDVQSVKSEQVSPYAI